MVTSALNTSWVPGKINQLLTLVPRSNLLSAEQKHQNLSSAMKTCTRTQGIKPRWSHNTNISRFKQLFFQVHIHPSQQKKGGRTDLWTSKNPTKAASKQGTKLFQRKWIWAKVPEKNDPLKTLDTIGYCQIPVFSLGFKFV